MVVLMAETLVQVAKKGHVDEVVARLASGTDPNKKDCMALGRASREGRVGCVKVAGGGKSATYLCGAHLEPLGVVAGKGALGRGRCGRNDCAHVDRKQRGRGRHRVHGGNGGLLYVIVWRRALSKSWPVFSSERCCWTREPRL